MSQRPPSAVPRQHRCPGATRSGRPLKGASVVVVAGAILALLGAAHADAGDPFDGSDPLYRVTSDGVAVSGSPEGVVGGTPRVIGGTLSARGRWPSVVALVRDGFASPADRQFCGGTVLAPNWVLTAAHCLFDSLDLQIRPAGIRVIEGVSDLRAESVEEEIVVTNLYVHPAYDHASESAYDDIALLELATELRAPPVKLFRGDPETLGARSGTIVGWGATDFETPRLATYPDALHQGEVPLVSREVCNDPASYAGNIVEGQLCAGFPEGGVDSCIGDSGGPLLVNTGERVEQVGVVSFGRGCAEPLFYGIYTSVSSYIDWIGDYVHLSEPTDEGEPIVDREPGDERPRGPVPTPVVEVPAARGSSDSGGGGSLSAVGSLLPLSLLLLLRRRTASFAALSLGALWTLGCAHGAAPGTTPLVDGAPGARAQLAGQHLGSPRGDALGEVSARTRSEPLCTFSKLAPVNLRKAFPLERCEYALDGRDAAAAPLQSADGTSLRVERLVLWFVDDRLVRLDARLSPSTAPLERNAPAVVRAYLDARFAPSDGPDRWRVGEDVASLGGKGDEAWLVVVHGSVLERLPGLIDAV